MAKEEHLGEGESVPFYPVHVRSEIKVMLGIGLVLLVIAALGMAFPVGLEAPADPMDTPAHVKPEWYFLALYQALKYIPKTTGVVLPLLAVGLLAVWPFLDRRPEASREVYKRRAIAVGIVLLVLIVFTIWGEVS